MGRFLITAADERTWRFDRPVLFLGEFCRLYNRRAVWERMDALVAKPYGVDPGEKERALAYTEALYGELLCETTDALNAFHETGHSRRYWALILGHWLRRFLLIAFNRYFTVERALSSHDVSGTGVLSGPYSLVTTTSQTLFPASNDDTWNHFLFARVVDSLGNVPVETQSDGPTTASFVPSWPNQLPGSWWKRVARGVAQSVLPHLASLDDALIIGSYLPLSTEIRLQLSLGQCPQFWRSPKPDVASPEPQSRQRFRLPSDAHSGFERFIRQQVGVAMPTCFLEGYRQLVAQVQSLRWPERPRFIFTSNNFDTDEVFKVWAASKIEIGVPYFIGQHGNNYGTHLLLGNATSPERAVADRFLTWGWTDNDPTTVAAFIFKSSARTTSYDPKGTLLLLEQCGPFRETPWDQYSSLEAYQEEQFTFVAALPDDIHDRLIVRLHRGFRYHQWFDEQRWKDRRPGTRVDAGASDLGELIRGSRLIVHSYDGTGMLETLSVNMPTLCFWDRTTEMLLPSAKPYYELLRAAGILVDSPVHAAETIARHWADVSKWWDSAEVQTARTAFCDQYARQERRPVRTLKRLLQTPLPAQPKRECEEAQPS